MKIPYVIDNQTHRMVDVLADVLGGREKALRMRPCRARGLTRWMSMRQLRRDDLRLVCFDFVWS